MADFDFSPRVSPMQGLSMEDLVRARTSPWTTALQSVPPALQALQQRRQMALAAQAMSQPGISQGTSSLSAEELQALIPILGEKAAAYGSGSQAERSQAFRKGAADVREKEAKASLEEAKAKAPGGGVSQYAPTPEESHALVQAMINGVVAPASITRYNAKIMGAALLNTPGYEPSTANIEFAAKRAEAEAGARLSGGGSSQVVARTAQSAKEQLGILKEMSDAFPRSDIQAMNTPIIALERQKYPEAQNWLATVNLVRYEYATALARGNKPGEEDIKDAKIALPDTITPTQVDAIIPVLNRLLEATVRGQMTPVKSEKSNKGDTVTVVTSDGNRHTVFRKNLPLAKKRDPRLKVIQ